jgi:porin
MSRSFPLRPRSPRSLGPALLAGCWLLLAPALAAAQPPPKPAGEPPVFETPPEEHLAGDWGGLRASLHDKGVDLSLEYKGEVSANISGGLSRGVDYAHLATLKADVDWGKLAGAEGFSTHIAFSNYEGESLSRDRLGDEVLAVQDAYIPGPRVVGRLDWLYAEQKLWNDRLDLAAGRMPVHLDYAKNPGLYCHFLSTSICGGPHTLPAQTAFTDLPFATWGGRAKLDLTRRVYVLGGAYEVNPDHGGRYGFDWSTRDATGVLLPLEVGFEPEIGASRLPGHYKLGFMYDSSRYPDLLLDTNGVPFAVSGRAPRRDRGRPTLYALADQMIVRHGKGPTNGLVLMAGAVRSDPSTFYLADLVFAGLVDQGVFRARPKDSLGLLVASAHISGELNMTQQLDEALGLPIANAAPGPQSHEWVFEANYAVHVTDGLSLQPDVQYVRRPDAVGLIPSAWVLGLRTDIHF